MSKETQKRRVLIVDDDPVIIKMVGTLLTTNGYEVLTATDAPVGLEIAMQKSPDLLILDVMMPIINGFNICRLMKTQSGSQHIPIILLTSRDRDDDRKIGEEVGANAYIAKPFKTEELLNTISGLLAAPNQSLGK